MSQKTQLLIGDILRRNASVVPAKTAAWMAGKSLTFKKLNDISNRFAWALHDQGFGYGDRIVCWTETSLDVLPIFMACAKLGAVYAPLNARYNAEEAIPVTELSKPVLIIADEAHITDAITVKNATGVASLASLGDFSASDSDLDFRLAPGEPSGNTQEYFEPQLKEEDPHVIFFTSGSTGMPKGVIISHKAHYLRTYQGLFVAEPEISICMFPLFHMAGFALILCAWQTRGEIVLVETPTAEVLLDAVQERKGTRLYCIPAVWKRILDIDSDKWDTSTLRFMDTGTSATPMELLVQLKQRFPHADLRIFYGSTEVGSGTALLDGDVMRKPGSVGQVSPGGELKLAEGGEICIRSDYLTDGYFDKPETTAEALRDGWFHTGDIGALDDEGYLSVVGRLKEIIRTGGESVAPVEVEQVLLSCPGVLEIAVVGIPDLQWGETVCAIVIRDDSGVEVSLDALQQHCADKLANFKKPRRLEFMDSFPKTPSTGQTQRTLLVEQILAKNY